ncbi:MAG: PAS domain-containing protein [Candidatus Geothermincolia bacterium]
MDTEMNEMPGNAGRENAGRCRQLERQLHCLYGISELVERPGAGLEDILRGISEILVAAFPYPELTRARVRLNGFDFRTGPSAAGVPCLAVPIMVLDEERGAIEITFTGEHPSEMCATLCDDERRLLATVAERLGRIVERTEAERALRDIEQFVTTVSETLPDLMTVSDTDGKLRRWNTRLPELTGLSAAELKDRYIWDIFPEASRESLRSSLRVALERGQARIEASFFDAHGSELIFDIVRVPLSDAAGKVVGIFSVARDITEKRGHELELLRSEELFRLLAENANDLIYRYRLKPEPGFEYVSPSATRVTGYTPEEHYADPELGLKLVHPDDRHLLEEARLGGVQTEPLVLRWQRKDGQVIWTEQMNVPVLDENGECVALNGVARDITLSKTAEQELLRSREEFSSVVNLSGDIIGRTDAKGRITFLNDEACDFFGKTRDEHLGHLIWETRHPDDWEFTDAALAQAIRERQPIKRMVNRHLTPAGWRHIAWNVSPLFDADDEFTGFQMTGRDITDSIEAEQELRDTRDFLDNLLRYANAPVIVWDPNFHITRFNQAFERLTGRNADEVVGKHLDLLFPGNRRDEAMGYIQRTMEGERWETVEIPIQTLAGEVHTVLWNSASLYGDDGSPTATIAQGQDITERKKAEDKLRETTEFLDSLIRYANAPILAVGTDLRITLCNQAFALLTGYDSHELIGRNILTLFPEDRLEELQDFASMALGGKRFETMEMPVECRKGEQKMLLWNSATLFGQDSIPYAIIMQGQDVTPRVQAQQELLRLNDELAGYAHTVSHDLRSPLANILLATEAIGEIALTPETTADPVLSHLLGTVRGSVWKATSLISDLLALGQAGQRSFEPAPVDISEVLQEIIEEHGNEMEAGGVAVSLEGDMGQVVGGRIQLYQLFGNLIGNALRYTAGRPGARIVVSNLAENGNAPHRFQVRDNGPGIPEYLADELFEPFRKGEGGGTGIGLAIVSKIVKMHGGEIRSHNDGGAVFELELFDLPLESAGKD